MLRSVKDANEAAEDDTSGPRYRRLAGECYLHGYMNGEACANRMVYWSLYI
jgi:hypothetical protein